MIGRSFVSAVFLGVLLTSSVAQGQEELELAAPLGRYELVLAPSYDLRTVASAGPTLHRMTQDVYLYGLRPQLSSGVDAVLGTAWPMFFSYATSRSC